jgi:hypothetical protein
VGFRATGREDVRTTIPGRPRSELSFGDRDAPGSAHMSDRDDEQVQVYAAWAMARYEIRDPRGRLIATSRSNHPILNALAVLFGPLLIADAVSGANVADWIGFGLVTWVLIWYFSRRAST